VLTEDSATESALKAVKGPRLLHVATHGFFLDLGTLQRSGADDTQRGLTAAAPLAADSISRSALLRSGLALAGANPRQGGNGEDGLLTALEAASLDLHGTQLVVLSACETGLGEVRSGDGVYGLRRALAVAGAESQVMSLWQVNDQATRDLMIAFYKRLVAGEGRAAALRGVQRELLGSPQRSHPFYWAAFVVTGDWTPLR
jgi:CHAT domain-containing protein